MPERVAPNPYSPYADAEYRHMFSLFLGIAPLPGVLGLAACGYMAVVPTEPLTDVTAFTMAGNARDLPPGLCPGCVAVATGQGDEPAPPPRGTCRQCESPSSHDDLCATCRQMLHDEWRAAQSASPAGSGEGAAS